MASVSEDSEDSDLEDDCIDISVTTFEEYAASAEFTFQLSPPSQVSSLPPSNSSQLLAYDPQPSPTPADDPQPSPTPADDPRPSPNPVDDPRPSPTPADDPADLEKASAKLTKDDRCSLDAFFMKITPERKAEDDKREFEELAAEREEMKEMKEKHERQNLLDKREKAKGRQQAFRDRAKAKKEEAGETSQQGKVSDDNETTKQLLIPYIEAKASRLRWSR
ncbi:hypothetical protein BT96DRAFT_831923 [Gymnopus androsaceus JB14]|uniref:Uncharacterized protein n=1 Tax=Gymnopus androsaceus JB14 TaxID=1447944 RepID=A0A6A4H2C4_9AGAR|nr:hypothetical protein BT96DRAFT_831923 [Gymnopus androsaceus JB14]